MGILELDLMEMWHTMNPVVKSAVIVLTIQGLWGVTVTIDRLLMLFMSKRRSKKFAKEVSSPMEQGDAIAAMDEGWVHANTAQMLYQMGYQGLKAAAAAAQRSAKSASRAASASISSERSTCSTSPIGTTGSTSSVQPGTSSRSRSAILSRLPA